jgi:hypothetical protein
MSLEQGGRAVNVFFEAMKSQPLSLALVVMNAALLGYLFYSGREQLVARNQYAVETQKILASCLHVDDIDKLMRSQRRD